MQTGNAISPGRRQGFSLIEVMVAMVLLCGLGLALFSWINSGLYSLQRVQERDLRNRVMRDALSLMETVNPMAEPAGSMQIGPYVIAWQASPLAEPARGSGYPAGNSPFTLALYDTLVTVTRAGQRLDSFTLRQVGWSGGATANQPPT
jgi:prepilin-type N-terminal cleavage/methylation domain-containing protein